MSRNLRYWSKFSLQNLMIAGLFILIALVLAVGWSEEGGMEGLAILPGMALMGMLFSFLAFGCGVVVLYLPLLVSLGETRRNVALGYHYYLFLTALLGTALWAVLSLAAGAGQEVLSGVPVVLAIQVIVAMAGSLVGVVYARYKWVGVAMIALLAGGTAGVFSFLMASNIMEENTFLSFDFRLDSPWLLLLAAVVVAVLEIGIFWLHFRRREVKL